MAEMILILDFGSQYTQLIARRVRELNVYCEIHPYNHLPDWSDDIKGVILSGSPCSVRDEGSPDIDIDFYSSKVPLLGVCYGAQLMAKKSGGNVLPSEIREYGRAKLSKVDSHHDLLKEITLNSQVWMSHADTIASIPEKYEVIASTPSVHVAAFKLKNEPVYGIQFHPEVTHTTEGKTLLRNFVVHICGCSQDWTPDIFVETTVADLKAKLGNDKVVMGLSGGVDSSVAAMLIHKAIGKNLHCIFVDNGLLRKNEFISVLESYKHMGLNVKGVDASQRFYAALKGLTEPEQKRKAIGRAFIEVFDEEAHKIQDVKWLGQGTIYPDVIESVSVKGPSATIKSHHNVGGLPEKMKMKVVEPLNTLFKDEVRNVGRTLEIDPNILGRHPFPGPGLGIRILSEITAEKVRVLQEVDHIFVQGLKDHGLYDQVWQAGAMLTPIQAVGVMGDERTYENVVALRAVTSVDGMTADFCHLPYEFLGEISSEIINKVKGVNRVVYDISSKPPATIEWE
ncbi:MULTISPECIES: glutamine-hydrolyzing GMP synthase [unclassified Imperialibacter]|uniref:glutamine-hydrolyzing GMP synthase n=1 Tax=unclassified Imperialibacter TaxID=2629706 RepID=UPI00125B419C|nr:MULTISPECIES: glutamine-hydrolyzing GMP synthase [unclassified Imperialibacter]CAD5280610.1 GMP synthetase (glutamine aminotransferase) [Imperialibacter sp. 75]CAD5284546.1 GMP synthetase (glutamine aminotransferase) [Imperialibacter sp. 89]VVT28326.1 GMP synthetase (glutamine aminotransferase) [Imperialibacter sp. EC-SDR9]